MAIKIYLKDNAVIVKQGTTYCSKEFESETEKNMWLWVLGSIYEETKINIIDERDNLQSHQFDLSCERGR